MCKVSRFVGALLVAAAAGLASVAHAANPPALPGAGQLGMSLAQLRQAVPQLRPLPHAIRLAGRLVGGWSAPAVLLAGVALTPTYFFADGELRRVDYSAAPDDSTDAGFSALREWGRSAWGPELDSSGPEGSYASWSADDLDAYLQRAAARPSALRLVMKVRAIKDASEL
jgi:hypothetical protein